MADKKKPGSARDGRVTKAPGSAMAQAGKFLSDLIGITEPRGPVEREAKTAGRSLIRPGGNPFALIEQSMRRIDLEVKAAAKRRNR